MSRKNAPYSLDPEKLNRRIKQLEKQILASNNKVLGLEFKARELQDEVHDLQKKHTVATAALIGAESEKKTHDETLAGYVTIIKSLQETVKEQGGLNRVACDRVCDLEGAIVELVLKLRG